MATHSIALLGDCALSLGSVLGLTYSSVLFH